jgi:hypothetical protein
MADNLTTQEGTGGPQVATNEIGGVHYARSKTGWGAPGVYNDVDASNPLPVQGPLTLAQLIAAVVQVLPSARQVDYWPGYGGTTNTGTAELNIDPGGALVTRGAVATDEGTFRVNFANTSLAVTLGTVTVAGRTVTGSGFISNTTRDVHLQDYFKLDADGESSWMQIETVDSDTQLTLRANYVGGTSGAASRALIRPETGAGGSIAVASGQCTLTSGTTINASTRIVRNVDYAPLVARGAFSVSQRIVNQTILFGLSEPFTTTDRWFARFRIDGTTNTTVICQSARNPTTTPSAAETQSTTVTLPGNATTATVNEYRVEMLTERVVFYINGVRVAEHSRSIPSQHDEMELGLRVLNGGTAPASSTSIVCDYITGKNHNKLEVGIFSDNEQIVAQQPDLVPFTYNVAGVIAINTVLLTIDCSRLRSLSIHALSIGTTGVVTPEWSNDPAAATWPGATLSTPAGGSAATFNAAGMWTTPVLARYFRLRLTTATTAGNTTLSVVGSALGGGFLPTQPVSGTVTANLGTGSLAAGTNAIGDVGLQVRANATGAASFSNVVAAASTNAQSVKGSAGRVLGWSFVNNATAVRYVKLHNVAAAPTAGTGVVSTIPIPPNGGVSNVTLGQGMGFGTGIGLTIVTGAAAADATAVAANDVVGTLFFA